MQAIPLFFYPKKFYARFRAKSPGCAVFKIRQLFSTTASVAVLWMTAA